MKELIYYINNITGEDEHCILNKKLNNYVNTCFDKGIDYGSKQRQFAIEMSDYYGGEIPQNILDTFINENYVDYIHENLSTHNAPLLQKKLLKFFSNSINITTSILCFVYTIGPVYDFCYKNPFTIKNGFPRMISHFVYNRKFINKYKITNRIFHLFY